MLVAWKSFKEFIFAGGDSDEDGALGRWRYEISACASDRAVPFHAFFISFSSFLI
jgi:hypothetical protein